MYSEASQELNQWHDGTGYLHIVYPNSDVPVPSYRLPED